MGASDIEHEAGVLEIHVRPLGLLAGNCASRFSPRHVADVSIWRDLVGKALDTDTAVCQIVVCTCRRNLAGIVDLSWSRSGAKLEPTLRAC